MSYESSFTYANKPDAKQRIQTITPVTDLNKVTYNLIMISNETQILSDLTKLL